MKIHLIAAARPNFMKMVDSTFNGTFKECRIPDLWDGKTAEQIAKLIAKI